MSEGFFLAIFKRSFIHYDVETLSSFPFIHCGNFDVNYAFMSFDVIVSCRFAQIWSFDIILSFSSSLKWNCTIRIILQSISIFPWFYTNFHHMYLTRNKAYVIL